MSFWKWSRSQSLNSTADAPAINWAEGQAPSTVNDSARNMMAAAAKFRDDISGAITTGGSSSTFTVTSYQGFDTLANMNGAMIAFTPHTTSGATVTLNVDSLGAKPLRFAPGAANELPAGTLVQGTPYVATYFNAANEWILQGLAGNPYNIPLGGMIEFTGTTAPNGSFVLPAGQAIDRNIYAAYFAMVGTTYGPGNGTSTFNVIDKRGRVSAGKDDMGGTAINRITNLGSGIVGTTLGANGGAQNVAILHANLPNVTFDVTIPSGQGSHSHGLPTRLQQASQNLQGGAADGSHNGGNVTGATDAATLPAMNGSAASGGSGTVLNKMPPTVIVNYILRVL